jgi:uncharacterized protein (TIGR02271 family)
VNYEELNMALYRVKDFDPDYRNHFDGDDVKDLDLYSGTDKIGSVNDVLVDEEGHFRYLIINTGAWIFGKKVMLPIGRARIDYNARRVYADGLTKQQVEQLPEFTDDLKIDHAHEEQVRDVYRGGASTQYDTPLEASAPLNSPVPLDSEAYPTGMAATGSSMSAPVADTPMTTPEPYNYNLDTDLYGMDRQDDRIRLYQERLIANKRRQKAGEVSVSKHVETETARVSVPVEKERVVIERVSPTDTTAAPGEAAFREGEVAHVEVYEETPDIRKEAFVREEVRVKKVVEQDTVTAEDQVRREELDIDSEGRPIVDSDRSRRM